jgi:hypothetical protein
MKILTNKQLDIVVKMMEAKLRWCGFNKRIKEKMEYRSRTRDTEEDMDGM